MIRGPDSERKAQNGKEERVMGNIGETIDTLVAEPVKDPMPKVEATIGARVSCFNDKAACWLRTEHATPLEAVTAIRKMFEDGFVSTGYKFVIVDYTTKTPCAIYEVRSPEDVDEMERKIMEGLK